MQLIWPKKYKIIDKVQVLDMRGAELLCFFAFNFSFQSAFIRFQTLWLSFKFEMFHTV